jgi:polyhydroxyalkanoate synthesis regulator phasin
MNGNDLVEHIEKCDKCQERQKEMEACETRIDALEKEIEDCFINTEIGKAERI